jgi:hypothetical protein
MACNSCGTSLDCGCDCSVTELPVGADGANGTNGANAYIYVASADDAAGTGYTYPADVTQCWLAVKSSTTVLTPVVANFAGLWWNKCGNGLVENTVFVDSVYGVDATGLVERSDFPFKTLAAARTAAITMTPIATKRIKIHAQQATWLNEQVVLYNYIDWDFGDSTLRSTTLTGGVITDNAVTCNSKILGRLNLDIATGVSGNIYGIFIDDASSLVSIDMNNLTISSEGGTVVRGIKCEGNLTINANDITVNGAAVDTAAVIANNGGTLVLNCNDISATSTGPLNGVLSDGTGSPPSIYIKANNITAANGNSSSGMYTIAAKTSAKMWVKCNNIYLTGTGATAANASAVFASAGTPELYVVCNDIIATPTASVTANCIKLGQTGDSATTIGAKLFVDCREANMTAISDNLTNYVVLMQNNTSNDAIAQLKGRFVSVSNMNLTVILNTTGKLLIQDSVIISNNIGLTISTAGVTKNYGGVVGTTNSSGTILVNGGIIGDTDVS